MTTLPRTPAEARAVGQKHYFTGIPCKRGHISRRLVSSMSCMQCLIISTTAYKKRNPGKAVHWNGIDAKRNPDRVRRIKAAYRDRNREKLREAGRLYSAANRPKAVENKRRLREQKPWHFAEEQRRRQAGKLRATPRWANAEKIKAIYAKAARITRETGIKHSVDHIVPLKSKSVCGLHVEDNLRVITLSENARKGNRFGIG